MAERELLTLALGSNLGNRAGYLRRAADLLCDSVFSGEVCFSRIYETPALLKPGSPKDWDIPYYNAAVCGECTLDPHEVLMRVKSIENLIGRRDRGVWAPREIDIDILLYGTRAIADPGLTVPHPLIYSRGFVLAPLADLFPGETPGYAASLTRMASHQRPKLVFRSFYDEKTVPA